MIQKTIGQQHGKATARVTFRLPAGLWADTVHLVGDFNQWNQRSHPLCCNRMGEWQLTIELEPGRAYQFRYLLNGRDWTADTAADAYSDGDQGFGNFVVVTPRAAISTC